jgi:hypothetical protein
MRVAAHEPAAPAAPPTRAFPTKTAPPTIIGATLVSGEVEKESSVVDSETIIIIYEIIFYTKSRIKRIFHILWKD